MFHWCKYFHILLFFIFYLYFSYENNDDNSKNTNPQVLYRLETSMVASASGTDRDLAAPLFRNNWGAYNIIAFQTFSNEN